MIQVRRGHTGQALVSLTGVPVEEDKVALCKPRREASGETSPGFPVISEVQALELREEKKFLCVSPPVYGTSLWQPWTAPFQQQPSSGSRSLTSFKAP